MRRIITFYSYKGGVGRTFALANIAVLLARRGRRVLVMDWDLEAPGLDRYFRKYLPEKIAESKGVLPMLLAATKSEDASWKEHIVTIDGLNEDAKIDLIPSGASSPSYAESLRSFSWADFFTKNNGGSTLERWRDEWLKSYDFILIDSRTGLSDIGGVCTILLPDILAAVFTASHQSTAGVRAVIDSAQAERQKLAVMRSRLTILPIPSRFDGREEVDLGEEWLDKFAEIFAPVMDSWLPERVPARDMLVKLKVPYVARFSFGEELAVETHGTDNSDLPGYSISSITDLIAGEFKNAAEVAGLSTVVEPTSIAHELEILTDGRFDRVKFKEILREVEKKPGGENEVSDLLNAAGLRLLNEAQFSDAEPMMRRALEIAEQSYGPSHPEVAIRLNNLAQLLQDTNRLSEAEPLMRRALEIDEQSYGLSHPDVAIVLNNLASLLQATNRLAEAEPLMRRALAIDEQSYGPSHPSVARDLNNLASLLQDTNRLAEAEPLMWRALAIDEQSYGNLHPKVAIRLNNLAQLLKATNRLAEAEPLMRRALEIDKQSYGESHPNVAVQLNNLARLLHDTSRLGEAEPLMQRALEIAEQSYGPSHPEVAIRLNNLAQLLQDTNRLAEAEPLMRRALEIDEQSYGPSHPSVSIDLNNLASLLQDTNRLEEAEPLMRRALAIDEQSYGESHPNVAIRLNNLALLLQDTNRLAEAEPMMRRALSIDEQSYGPSHPQVAIDLNNLAGLLQATNRLAEAEPMMRRMAIIFLQFMVQTGHEHPHLRAALRGYTGLCEEMKLPEEEFWPRMLGMCRDAGMDFETAKKILTAAFQ